MKNTDSPVELLLLALFAVAWAAVTITRAVVVPLVALVVTLLHPRPRLSRPETPREPLPPAPAANPLQTIAAAAAESLTALPVRQLRQLARSAGLPRTLAHRGRRDALISALVGVEVALV